jgi:hypothetical protein
MFNPFIYSRNLLYLVLVYGHLGVDQSLLKHGVDSTTCVLPIWTCRTAAIGARRTRNDRGRTPLQVVLDGVKVGWAALQAERYQVVQLLLQHSAESTKWHPCIALNANHGHLEAGLFALYRMSLR